MRRGLKALVAIALSAIMPAAVNAADFLTYTFAFTGNEFHINNSIFGAGYNGPTAGNIVYNLPAYFAGSNSASFAVPAQFGQSHTVSGSNSGNVFTLREIETQVGRSDRRDITIKACLASGIPGPTIAIDPSCSAVDFTDAISLGIAGGDLRILTGTITGLTVTEGFGPATLGLVSYPVASLSAVPEAGTWAMVILGVGAVGFAMRRRQSKVTTTVAFA